MDTYRISIVRSSTAEYMDEDALLHVLRPHLIFQEISHETYIHLKGALPKGAVILVDHRRDENGFVDLDIGRALVDYEKEQKQLSEKKTQDQKDGRGADNKTKATPKKRVRKGLTAKQAKELETLREELRNV